jgi:hypothetical protein
MKKEQKLELKSEPSSPKMRKKERPESSEEQKQELKSEPSSPKDGTSRAQSISSDLKETKRCAASGTNS